MSAAASAYRDLLAFQRDTEALGQVMGRLGWDQETVMPRGAAEQRSEEVAALEGVLHARRTDPRLGEWLDAAAATDDVARANLRIIRRSFERNARVPGRLAAAIARATSRAQGIWADARRAEDLGAFLPTLKEVVRLKREEAQAIARDQDPYDALLHDYEPGTSSADLAAMFGALRPRLVSLRDRVRGAAPAPKLQGRFDEDAQLRLSVECARAFGYDFERGRIDRAVHPFSSGSGQDVRITTRTSPEDPFNCIYSTIHETGHATYEQNIEPGFALTPLGQGVSMGVHESQSRIYENQLGRSRAFCHWLFGRMRDSFGDLGIADEAAFYRAVNRVHGGFIRTEADEVQYNLHVLLRFDLEQALIRGDLQVGDLEAAWNDRFEQDFGYPVGKPSDGMLQDVHWSVGLFGYFPTYSLGNVYAGCLHEAMRRALPDLDDDLARGDAGRAVGWLRDSLQRHGGLREPRDTVAHAIGGEPGPEPLLRYLEAKFGDLYGLG